MKTARHLDDLVAMIPDGATLMIGGFFGVGSPLRLIQGLAAARRKGLMIIANDTAYPGVGIGKLIEARLVKPWLPRISGPTQKHSGRCSPGNSRSNWYPRGRLPSGSGPAVTAWGACSPKPAWAHSSNRENPPSKSTARSGCWKNRSAPTSRWSAPGKPTTLATSRTSSRRRTSTR